MPPDDGVVFFVSAKQNPSTGFLSVEIGMPSFEEWDKNLQLVEKVLPGCKIVKSIRNVIQRLKENVTADKKPMKGGPTDDSKQRKGHY